VTFGTARGFERETILRFTNECLGPSAAVLLVVGLALLLTLALALTGW
jgi:hypothetical protein